VNYSHTTKMYRRTTDITTGAMLQHAVGSNATCNDIQTHENTNLQSQ